MKDIILYIIIILFVGSLGIGIYFLQRWVNYNLGYESQVMETICQVVKPEYLKEGSCK